MTRAQLIALEWQGCGCSQKEEAACPACGGLKPLTEHDRTIKEFYGHRPGCWLAADLHAA